MFTKLVHLHLCAASKSIQEKEKPLDSSACNCSFCSHCCSGGNFVVHCDARAARTPGIRISVFSSQGKRMASQLELMFFFAGERCLKRCSIFKTFLNPVRKKIKIHFSKEDAMSLLLNPSALSGLMYMSYVFSLHAYMHLSHTHTRLFLLPNSCYCRFDCSLSPVCVTTDDSNFVIAF